MKRYFIFLIAIATVIVACKKDKVPVLEQMDPLVYPDLPATPFSYSDFVAPSYMTGQVYTMFSSTPINNPVTDEGATLGRVLFYDKHLSANDKISCSSCHQQEYAFTDPSQFSEGLHGQLTARSSMAIINSFMGFRYFWDLRANSLEEQSLMPIQHPVEMDMTLDALVLKLDTIPYYPALFENAFGTTEITAERISMALSQFMRSIYSVNSKFDQGMENNFADYTAQELWGKDLFFVDSRTECNSCHQTYYFFDPSPHNNGSESVYTDEGVGGNSGIASQIGKFKTPTLRNIEYTAPYFHDGRFATLEEVIQFYNSGIQQNPNLDDRLTTDGQIGGSPVQMNLTQDEIDALVAFLKTLSEPALLTNERWSDPFN